VLRVACVAREAHRKARRGIGGEGWQRFRTFDQKLKSCARPSWRRSDIGIRHRHRRSHREVSVVRRWPSTMIGKRTDLIVVKSWPSRPAFFLARDDDRRHAPWSCQRSTCLVTTTLNVLVILSMQRGSQSTMT